MAWTILVFGAIGIVLTIVYRLRHKAAARPDAAARKIRSRHSFQSVEIRAGSRACSAARRREGQRFLAADAPSLPLAGCTAERCTCSYKKLEDRREETRRWSDEGLGVTIFNAEERRSRGDRRSD